jgi:hypothetical protein
LPKSGKIIFFSFILCEQIWRKFQESMKDYSSLNFLGAILHQFARFKKRLASTYALTILHMVLH